MRRIGRISGRSDDMLIIRGVNVFPTQIEELILEQPELAPHYQLEVIRDGYLDTLIVRVEVASGHDGDGAARAAAAALLVYKIKAYIGISVRVEVCDPNQ